jgi:uncharacterized OB-fold protein
MLPADDSAPSPAAAWAEHCRARRLAYQVAPDGTPVFPPRLAQPGTGAPLRWVASAGRGEVHATTVVRRRGEAPHNVALVELDEGFRMMSSVVGLDPQDVRIGLRVRLAWREDDVPVFEADT